MSDASEHRDAPGLIEFSKGDQRAKWDFQLKKALMDERRLANIFLCFELIAEPKIELKTETKQWEETRNICIEIKRDDKPSGISITEADMWVHELKTVADGRTLCYLMFPIDRLKELVRDRIKRGLAKPNSGDGKRQTVVTISLLSLLS